MFTVLTKTRNSNLFLIDALVIAAVALLTLAVVPAISVPSLSQSYRPQRNMTMRVNSG